MYAMAWRRASHSNIMMLSTPSDLSCGQWGRRCGRRQMVIQMPDYPTLIRGVRLLRFASGRPARLACLFNSLQNNSLD